MKALDPQKCPTMVKVLDAICYFSDATGYPALSGTISKRAETPRICVNQAIRALEKKGLVRRKLMDADKCRNKTGKRPYVVTPLYRSNGEPYKRDASLAEPVKAKGTKTICPPGYPRGYKISPVTVRPTAPYKPSTEGMW